VIAITDRILMKRDLLGRASRLATFGLKHFSVRESDSRHTSKTLPSRGSARCASTTCSSCRGAEITQNHIRSKKNSHIVGLNLSRFVSADQPAEDILREIRRQGAVTIACHPHHRPTRRVEIGTCYLWNNRKRLTSLVDVWEAANRDDLFSVTSLKHFPYVANSDFHKPKHLYSWKTLLRAEKNWEAIARALRENVDVALTLYRNGSWVSGDVLTG
jgi:hypothetical protein